MSIDSQKSSPETSRQKSVLVVTTSVGHRPQLIAQAQSLSEELGAPYFPRTHKGLGFVMAQTGASKALIVESDGLVLADSNGLVYRYHPNMGLIRALNLLKGQRDLFADATGLQPGDRILDCTLGFACEAIIAAILVGESGRVVGLESITELALVTRSGLQGRVMTQKKVEEPMRRIEVVNSDYREHLRTLVTDEFDVIYFDPFFNTPIDGSQINIDPLAAFGDRAPLVTGAVLLALKKAAKRVVVKHPRGCELASELTARCSRVVTGSNGTVSYSVFKSKQS